MDKSFKKAVEKEVYDYFHEHNHNIMSLAQKLLFEKIKENFITNDLELEHIVYDELYYLAHKHAADSAAADESIEDLKPVDKFLAKEEKRKSVVEEIEERIMNAHKIRRDSLLKAMANIERERNERQTELDRLQQELWNVQKCIDYKESNND